MIGTIHGLSCGFLKEWSFYNGIPSSFNVADEEKQILIIKKVIKTMNEEDQVQLFSMVDSYWCKYDNTIDFLANEIKKSLEKFKNNAIWPTDNLPDIL